MHPTSFTKHSSHEVTNEMYIIKTKHIVINQVSINKIVSFKVECILRSHSLQVNNMKIAFLIEICAHEFIYLFTKLKALEIFSVINPCSKGGAILTSKNKVCGVNE